MADISGPVNSLPGSGHTFPEGTVCDNHPDVLAVARRQGETDSYGAEYSDLCQVCLDAWDAEIPWYKDHCCDWCKKSKEDIQPTRDYGEGTDGPVYYVCRPCRRKQDEDTRKELEWMHRNDPDDEDLGPVDDEPFDYPPEDDEEE